MVKTDDRYDFLRTRSDISGRVELLTLGGSHAYGVAMPTSDVDIRGCSMEAPAEIIGMSKHKTFVNTETDTVIYGFNELVRLLMDCNPNTIEMLGCLPEHYLYLGKAGRMLLANKKLFLSKRVVYTFSHYATKQFRRFQTHLPGAELTPAMEAEFMKQTMEDMYERLMEKYPSLTKESLQLYLEPSQDDDDTAEIMADINIHHFPARDFNCVMNELKNAMDSYHTLSHRNRKKDTAHLNKHAAHLIRLYLMCLDILEKEEIVTYRKDDIPLLMSVRNGDYMKEDGTYRQEFYDMLAEYQKRLDYAADNTSLPEKPNKDAIEDLVVEVNREVLR